MHSTISALLLELEESLAEIGCPEHLNPAALATMTNKKENPTHKEVTASPDTARL